MGWKQKIYDRLVRSDPRIRREYERYVMEHLEEHRTHRWRHWRLLLALHWHYHIRKRTSPYLPQHLRLVPEVLRQRRIQSDDAYAPLCLLMDACNRPYLEEVLSWMKDNHV